MRVHRPVFAAIFIKPLDLHPQRDLGIAPHLALNAIPRVILIVLEGLVLLQNWIYVLNRLDMHIPGHGVVVEPLGNSGQGIAIKKSFVQKKRERLVRPLPPAYYSAPFTSAIFAEAASLRDSKVHSVTRCHFSESPVFDSFSFVMPRSWAIAQ